MDGTSWACGSQPGARSGPPVRSPMRPAVPGPVGADDLAGQSYYSHESHYNNESFHAAQAPVKRP
jgi:hypothetical protein